MGGLGIDAATVAYFIAGLVGSLARVAVGSQSTFSRRTWADVIMGALGGMILPWLGVGLGSSIGVDAADAAKFPVIVKAAIVALMMYAGSHAFAAILHKRDEPKP